MGKSNIIPGSGTLEEFFGWMNERHRIYERRATGESRPWTRDVILRDYKFTNVFRELDRGTVLLRKAVTDRLSKCVKAGRLTRVEANELELASTVLYRMINFVDTFEECGFLFDPGPAGHPDILDEVEFAPAEAFEKWIIKARAREARGDKMFTSAHMTVGAADQSKLDTVIDTVWEVINNLQEHTSALFDCASLSRAAEYIQDQKWFGIGPFINYEIVSDLRWSLCKEADDIYVWANIGPGCKRGLVRLGLPVELGSLRWLHARAPSYLKRHMLKHYDERLEWVVSESISGNKDAKIVRVNRGAAPEWPPFELREIEHSLCEFDKYSRALQGTGRPKQYFNGKGD